MGPHFQVNNLVRDRSSREMGTDEHLKAYVYNISKPTIIFPYGKENRRRTEADLRHGQDEHP